MRCVQQPVMLNGVAILLQLDHGDLRVDLRGVQMHVPEQSLHEADAERGPDEDLRLQFEAVQQLTPEEKEVVRSVLEGLVLKHIARKWSGAPATATKPPPSPPAPAKRAAAKRLAATNHR